MLHALLQGKLDASRTEPERREDVLTSTVFGTLVLVEAWEPLARWLGVPGSTPVDPRRCDCWFWPRLAAGVEPDVLLRLDQILVVVEAKYRSGRHDLLLDEEEEERPVDQIVRQYHAVSPPHDRRQPYSHALEEAVRQCHILQAFVVDARRIRKARKEHAESIARLPKEANVNLVTWQALYHLVRASGPAAEYRWARDLMMYLRLCGLASFQGVPRDLTAAARLEGLVDWKPFSRRRTEPGVRTAAALLANEPAIANLRRWPSAVR